MCSYCRSIDSLYIDYKSGDTVCLKCGTCNKDVLLDATGRLPPDLQTTRSTNDISESSRFRDLNKQLQEFYTSYDIPDALQNFGLVITGHMEHRNMNMQGSNTTMYCLAIIYLIYKSSDVFWDIESVCKQQRVKPKQVIKLSETLDSSSLANSNSFFTDTIKLQKNIVRVANDLGIEIKKLDVSVIDRINKHMSCSTKMKTAVALLICSPTLLDAIATYTEVKKQQLLKAKKEYIENHSPEPTTI